MTHADGLHATYRHNRKRNTPLTPWEGRTMTPTYRKSRHLHGYLPVIKHEDGRAETLYGPPLTNGITATKYAAIEIRDRTLRHTQPQFFTDFTAR